MDNNVGADDPIARYSPRMLALFRAYLRGYLARSFNALRISGPFADVDLSRPTVLYMNHPSWWDPIVLLYALTTAFPRQRFFAPIDSAALARYPILRRFGMFGIEPGSKAGAARFRRLASELLAEPERVLCVTAEGVMSDPRMRPVRLKRGVAHLLAADIAEQAVPVAVEYPFWYEKRPEALIRLGAPVRTAEACIDTLHAELEAALERTLDELAAAAVARDAEAFHVSLAGRRRGVGGAYDAFGRLRAWAAGRSFEPSHEAFVQRSRRG